MLRVLFVAQFFFLSLHAAPSAPGMLGNRDYDEEFQTDYEAAKACEESGDCKVLGDVVIPTGDVGAQSGVVDYSWPDGVLPYQIDEATFTGQNYIDLVHKAAVELSNQTCVTVRPRQESDAVFLTVSMAAGGCSTSPLGYREGYTHRIRLAAGCFNVGTGTVMHEFIHSLGFYHEQSRDDRDAYVHINWEHMKSDASTQYQFRKASEDGLEVSYFGVKYNYESIMHYPPYAFNADGGDTITSLDNPEADGSPSEMGQRSHLSTGDIQMINGKYGQSTKCMKKK